MKQQLSAAKEAFSMRKTTTLFLTFLKIGAFTFGGGYAMIALLKDEFVSKKRWITEDDFYDMAAIAESTPGPVAINSATYIGYRTAGFLGALVSTLAVCIPSFLIIYLISLYFDAFLHLTYVQYAFQGIRAGVIYLIFSAGIQMAAGIWKKKNRLHRLILFAVAGTATALSLSAVRFSTLLFIFACGAIGVSVYLAGLPYHTDTARKILPPRKRRKP